MPTITVRGLSDGVRDGLKELAARTNRSLEAEAQRTAGGPPLH